MKNILFICSLTLLVACGTENTESNTETASTTETVVAEHNATSKFSIEGMTCEIGCVRTVQSRLAKMPGVLNINMDFDTARATNYSTVDFDKSIISDADMKAEIESIANGIYAVTDVSAKEL